MAVTFSSSILFSFLLLTITFQCPAFASLPNMSSNKVSNLESKADSGGGGGSITPIELWCVAKNNAENQALQSALDWACGPGGSDCTPIQQGGPCYDPTTIQTTASFAFNDYFLKHGVAQDSCNFAGTAALTSLNPSRGNCKFPSSFTVTNGSFTALPTIVGIGPAGTDMSSTSLQILKGSDRVVLTVPLLLGIAALLFQ